MKNVAIIDYGLGNLFSIANACEVAGLKTTITAQPDEIRKADGLILPGVGAFGIAINHLTEFGITDEIYAFVKTGKPFLGICLGMQLLFTQSSEFGEHNGLNLIGGQVNRFPNETKNGEKLDVPQIQWNQIFMHSPDSWNQSSLRNIKSGSYMHFVHSYFVNSVDEPNILCETTYGDITYTSGVMKENITGFQFHPEKSGKDGIQIYKDWAQSF